MGVITYRRDIDGLRALAVIPVVLAHAGFAGTPGGFVGVDIFFVISGFLITNILAREIGEGRFSLLGFYERRARRILPALIAVLAACFAVGWLILLPDEYANLAKSAAATTLFSSNFWFLYASVDYFGEGMLKEPLMHTWSLAVEEQFYLFFPLLLMLLARSPRRVWCWVVGAISLASLALSIALTSSDPTWNFYLLPTRAWELGLGAMIALGLPPVVKSRGVAEAAGAIGLLLIIGSVVLIDESTPFPGLAALPPCLGAAAIIWAGQNRQTVSGTLLSGKVLVWFGLISYSLYLWHWPVLVAARLIGGSDILPPAIAAGCVALSVVLGWASWRFIERPFRNSKSGQWQPRWRIFAAATAAMALVLAVSAVSFLAKGWPSRVPQQAYAQFIEVEGEPELAKKCMNWKLDNPQPCSFGAQKSGPPDYVFWGDSHAGAILDGFDQRFAEQGQSAVAHTYSGCGPLPSITYISPIIAADCDRAKAHTLAQIDTRYSGATIVLVARWALLAEGVRVPGENGADIRLKRNGEAMVPISQNAQLLEEGLDDVVAHLRANGHEVWLVSSVPEHGLSMPRLMARAAMMGRPVTMESDGMGQQAITAAQHQARTANSARILADVAKRHGAKVIDLGAILCAERCRLSAEGQSLYRDDDHLSSFGAKWVVARALP